MKKTSRRFALCLVTALSVMLPAGGVQADASLDKDVMIEVKMPEETYTMDDVCEGLYNQMSFMGSAEKGYDVEEYFASPIGQWNIEHFSKYWEGGDQNDPEVYAYWESIGMVKHYYEASDEVGEWSIFTPQELEEGKLYPTVVVMHMGAQNIYFAENMGYVEDAAKNDYIVLCVSWDSHNLTDAITAAYEESGLKHYEAYAFKTTLEKAEAEYPIDPSRVYVAGFSGVGNACAYVALEFPELIAGVSPSTGVAIQANGLEDLAAAKEIGLPFFMFYGEYDAEQRWPLNGTPVELGPAQERTPTTEERLSYVESWHEAAGAVQTTTVEDIEELTASDVLDATSIFGLHFADTYEKQYEAMYYFGDMTNSDGQVVARYMSIEGCPHYVSPEVAGEIYLFFSHFSRDLSTGALVID